MRRLRLHAAAATRKAWFAMNRGQFVDFRVWRRPRVFVDVSVIVRHDAKTGIQRVVRAIWSELSSRKHPIYDFVPVYAGANHGYCIANHEPLERQGAFLGTPVAAFRGDKFLGLDLTAHYLPNCGDQLDAWRSAGASVHTVIYDLLPLTRGEWFNARTRSNFTRWFETVVTHSDQLLCISDDVAGQVERRLGHVATPKVGRLYLSGDISGSQPSTGSSAEGQALLERLRTRTSVLMVGTVEPRKGYQAALAAMERLWLLDPHDSPDLVIVGKPGWKTDEVQSRLRKHPMLGRKLHWLEQVSDEELSSFYAAATFLLVASRAEGFGLPLSEAALHGRWVLARDLPVFHEQLLPNVRFFDDDEPEAFSEQLRKMIALAETSPAPEVVVPTWETCLDRLLVEIGVDPREDPHHLSEKTLAQISA